MRRGRRSAGVSPPQNGRLRVVLSHVGDGGVLAIQGLAQDGEGNAGRNATESPLTRRAAILQENGLLKSFGGSRFAV